MKLEEQNILFIVKTMGIGGTENVVLQLCEILTNKANNIVVCSTGGVHEEELNKMKIKHYCIPDISSKNPIDMIECCFQIKKIIKDENITIVHSHHRMAAFYTELVAPKYIKKIANAHNTFQNKKRLTHFAYRNTELIAVGEMVKGNLTEYFGVPEEQICVIHNAVKPFDGKLVPDKQLHKYKENGNFLVGNIGRLSEQKGMEYFIESIPYIIKSIPNAMFFIAGSGEDEEKLKKLAETKKVRNKLVFLGYRDDVQNLMMQLDLIVLSSLWEGLPLTPIEAYSVGKTVVATAVDGTVEIVRDGVDGYLIEPKNSKAIAEKVIDLFENTDKRIRFEKAAVERYKKEFSFDTLERKYLEYYERL